MIKKRKDAAFERWQRILQDKGKAEKFLGQDDPLYGVLNEEQVGICTATGRRKIYQEVLDEMMANEEDKLVRIDRIRSSVADAEKDPMKQKSSAKLRVCTCDY